MVGSTTKDKTVRSYELAERESSRLVTKSASVMRLINWVVDDNTLLSRTIEELVSKVTDAHPSRLKNLTGKVHGDVNHRLQGSWNTCAYLTGINTDGRFFFVETGSMKQISGGGDNYNVFV